MLDGSSFSNSVYSQTNATCDKCGNVSTIRTPRLVLRDGLITDAEVDIT